jgi:predicted ArsR family transcriptional regulator
MNPIPTCQEAGPHPQALTPRQREVFGLIRHYYEALEEPVPARYVAMKLNITHEGARHHLAALHHKGWLVGETSPAVPRPFLLA